MLSVLRLFPVLLDNGHGFDLPVVRASRKPCWTFPLFVVAKIRVVTNSVILKVDTTLLVVRHLSDLFQ